MTEPPDDADPRPSLLRRIAWLWPLAAGVVVGILLRLVFSGAPGEPYSAMMASFTLLVPMLVGAVTVYAAERRQRHSWGYYFGVAAAANALFVLGTLFILIEGLVCAIVAVPLFALLGGLGGLLAGAVCRWTRRPRRMLYCAAALPLLLGAVEQRIPLPDSVDTVVSARVIAAPPERVWTQLLQAPRIEPHEMESGWMYRIGAPLPISAVTEQRDGDLIRHIRMGRGVRFDQVAAEWQPMQRVVWRYRFTADSFPPGALDDHVRIGGRYFDLIDTAYVLEPIAGGTRLTTRMRYRVSTHFNWYARPLAKLLVRNFEQTALEFYATRAEMLETSGR